MAQLEITYLPTNELKPYPGNARTHSRKQIRLIKESIQKHEWVNPIVIDSDRMIIAGHGRYLAAKELEYESVPTILIDHMTPADVREYRLKDNKLAELAGWDKGLLGLELQFLSDPEHNIELEDIGFSAAEIDLSLEATHTPASDMLNAVPPAAKSGKAISQLGSRWKLGNHYLYVGDATKKESFDILMGGKLAQLVVTDLPYNVPMQGHATGLGKNAHREFAMASGEMSSAEFVTFLTNTVQNLRLFSANGSIHYLYMDWRHVHELLTAAMPQYSELKNICVWNKTNAGMGSFYRSKHELVFVFKSGTKSHINNFELGQNGRYRTNVWDYAGVNTFKANRDEELAMHPTVKPVEMIADAIKDCSKRGGIVLDSFAGSGTIFIAAERTGRRAYGMEIDPLYADVAIKRWQEFTGEAAVNLQTNMTFDESCKAVTGAP